MSNEMVFTEQSTQAIAAQPSILDKVMVTAMRSPQDAMRLTQAMNQLDPAIREPALVAQATSVAMVIGEHIKLVYPDTKLRRLARNSDGTVVMDNGSVVYEDVIVKDSNPIVDTLITLAQRLTIQ